METCQAQDLRGHFVRRLAAAPRMCPTAVHLPTRGTGLGGQPDGPVPTHGNRGLREGPSAAGQRHTASSMLRALPSTSAEPPPRLPGVTWA